MTLVAMKVEEGCDGVRLTPASVRKVTELVDAKIEDGLTLNEMAESAGLSTGYFSQVFRKSMGETPHQFLLRPNVCGTDDTPTFATTEIAQWLNYSVS
jgi:AraC-like DNA-binding protein